MEKGTKGAIITGAAMAVAATIATLLLAPKSGKETREDIKSYIHEMKDKIADELTKMGDIPKDAYNELVEKIVKVYELEKKITAEEAEDIRQKLDQNYEEIKKIIKE